MRKSIIIVVLSMIIQGVASDVCYYYPTINTKIKEHCNWGCCYTTIYPCCDEPLIDDPGIITAIVLCSVGGCILLVGLIVTAIRRRRRQQHGAVLAGTRLVVTGPNSYAPYQNQQHSTMNMYATQAPYGNTNMYATQAPYGNTSTYGYQPVPVTTPSYGTNAPNGTNLGNQHQQYKQ